MVRRTSRASVSAASVRPALRGGGRSTPLGPAGDKAVHLKAASREANGSGSGGAARIRPDTSYFERGSHPDGEAFCAAALRDIRRRTARGEKVQVVFDIDNTLVDTRARTLAVAHEFDRRHGTHFFDALTLDQVGHDGRETCARLHLSAEVTEAFDRYWTQAFWSPENLRHDLPLEPLVRLARAAHAAGADVQYLTGRTRRYHAATLAQLQRLGLPNAQRGLVCKPSLSNRTAPFKAKQLADWIRGGHHIAWFLTEGRRDIAHLQRAVPEVPCVLLDCSLGGAEAVAAGTPLFPRQF